MTIKGKMNRICVAILLTLLATVKANPQVKPPKHESGFHHLFAPHRDSDDLSQRFNDLKCALVLIQAGPRLGTGFFVSPNGDVVTAAHVLGDRTFTMAPNGQQIIVSIALPATFALTDSSDKKHSVPAQLLEFNPDAWLSDVARIHTGITTSCWLAEGDDQKARPGEHLIAMGFPGVSFQALTIYSGIMAARLKTNLPTIVLNTGQAVQAPNDFIRVQMPISPGLSGAPLIDDENEAIGIITDAGGWTPDLQNLVALFQSGAFALPPVQNPPVPAPGPSSLTPSPGPTPVTVSLPAATAELAALFHDYASPGYGDAVPLRYLEKSPQQNQPPASRNH